MTPRAEIVQSYRLANQKDALASVMRISFGVTVPTQMSSAGQSILPPEVHTFTLTDAPCLRMSGTGSRSIHYSKPMNVYKDCDLCVDPYLSHPSVVESIIQSFSSSPLMWSGLMFLTIHNQGWPGPVDSDDLPEGNSFGAALTSLAYNAPPVGILSGTFKAGRAGQYIHKIQLIAMGESLPLILCDGTTSDEEGNLVPLGSFYDQLMKAALGRHPTDPLHRVLTMTRAGPFIRQFADYTNCRLLLPTDVDSLFLAVSQMYTIQSKFTSRVQTVQAPGGDTYVTFKPPLGQSTELKANQEAAVQRVLSVARTKLASNKPMAPLLRDIATETYAAMVESASGTGLDTSGLAHFITDMLSRGLSDALVGYTAGDNALTGLQKFVTQVNTTPNYKVDSNAIVKLLNKLFDAVYVAASNSPAMKAVQSGKSGAPQRTEMDLSKLLSEI